VQGRHWLTHTSKTAKNKFKKVDAIFAERYYNVGDLVVCVRERLIAHIVQFNYWQSQQSAMNYSTQILIFTRVSATTTTRDWALDRVHNSRRTWCGADSLSGVTAERDGAARLSRRDFLHFLTLWPWPLTFWPYIHWWARYRDGLSLCQVWQV